MGSRNFLDKLRVSASGNIKERDYWLSRLSGEIVKSHFPYDYLKTNENARTSRLESLEFRVAGSLYSNLMRLSSNYDYTLYMVLVAGLIVMLRRYTYHSSSDVLLGAPIYKQDIKGEFINTALVLKNRFDHRMTFKDLLLQVKQTITVANENQNYPIELILDHLNMSLSREDFPLFEMAILLENIHERKYLKHIPLNMVLSFHRMHNCIRGKLEYNASLYRESTVEKIIEQYTRLLKTVLCVLDKRLFEIDILSQEDREEILFDFNQTQAKFSVGKTIDELFAEKSEKTPDQTAIIGNHAVLTYRESKKESHQLANLLIEKGARSGDIVGLRLERSLEMVIGVLGILRAGGAYIPIDPSTPGNRVAYMLADSGAKMLLTTSTLVEEVRKKFEVNALNSPLNPHLPVAQVHNFTASLSSGLAYIIYTSGSTGKPKGVMVEHQSVMNVLAALFKYYPLTVNDTYLLKTSIIFDVSVSELFGWFWGGGRLAILEREGEKDPQRIICAIEKEFVTHINFVPSMFQAFMDWLTVDEYRRICSLKYIFLAGEALSPWIIKRFREINRSIQIENIYGPTETTIYASRYSLDYWDGSGRIPIGKPLDNMKLYIVDQYKNLMPVGAIGELIIGGLGVARGYLNQPELTAEKFEHDLWDLHDYYDKKNKSFCGGFRGAVFSKSAPLTVGDKIYKTGDLARWLPDGNIEFLGRLDHQVKIRGFRVELGEIENHFLSYPSIKEAVIIIKEKYLGNSHENSHSLKDIQREDHSLCAYVVAGQGFTLSGLKEHLGNELPAYMIPLYIIQLEKIPLTSSGKVDRKALPNPEINTAIGTFTAPRNNTEKRLAEIWSEVLGIEADKISIDRSFFALGGHSLKATKVISKVHREFNVRLIMTEVFKIPTLREMAACIQQTVKDNHHSIDPVEKKEYYPLSPAQSRLYVLQQVDPGAVGYNMPIGVKLAGKVHRDKIEVAFKKLIQRHEILRTSFEMKEDEPVQRVHTKVQFRIDFYSSAKLGNKEIRNKNSGRQGERQSEFIKSFDLSRSPLLRAGLIKVAEEEHVLMVDMHHIAADGTSLGLLVNQFTSFYLGEDLPPLRIQYKDFSKWKTDTKEVEAVKQQKQYWQEQFENQPSVLNLPLDNTRPAIQGFAGNRVDFEIGQKETKALKQLALREEATLYMALLGVINVLLSKLSGQEEVVIGSPIAGRRHVDLEPIIGMFANTLALRNYPSREKNFIAFLGEIKESTLSAYENQDYPFEELVDSLNLQRDASRNPVFDVLFVLQNMEQTKTRQVPGMTISDYPLENLTAKFDLQFNAIERQEKLLFTLEYSTALFREATIRRMIEHFNQVVSEVIKNPAIKLADLEIIGPEEKQEILEFSRGPQDRVDNEETIHHWFEQKAKTCEDKIALVFEDQELSYRELNRRTGQLAAHLVRKGVRPDTVVGLMAERSIEMVIGILAILKAEGAYLPIDIDYPDIRIKYLLEDSGIQMVLEAFSGNSSNGTDLPTADIINGIEMIDIRNESLYLGDVKQTDPIGNGNTLLYVIYTSGSTGQPKGVMMEHKGLVNLLRYQLKYTNIPFRRVLQFITISFDVSFQEIFSTLTAGGKLYLIDKETQTNIPELFKIIEKNEIETLFFPASFLKFVLNEEENLDLMPRTVAHIITAGEQLIVSSNFRKHLQENNIWLHNHYGPAEAHVVTTLTLNPAGEIPELPTIGKPVSNTGIYIVDKEMHLQPMGVLGELFIAGIQVGRGYWRRKQLTSERFMNNPFMQGERLYKTGDLARWLCDGNIEFLGRIDHQVKIRGFRVEPGEIENHLMQIPAIKEAVVMAHQANKIEKYLCAYVVSDEVVDRAQLRNILSQFLPDYMIPAYFIQLEQIPLTPNKKVDRAKLPEPGITAPGDNYTGPRDKIEKQLVEIWLEVLKLEAQALIGIDDNFFELGGHSLRATVMMTRVQRRLKVKITLGDIFKYPTIRNLAGYIKEKQTGQGGLIESVEKKEYYPLSSAQQRLFIVNQTSVPNIVYNLPVALIVEGPLQRERLQEVFKEILTRHESLRTSFGLRQGKPVQIIHEEVLFAVEYYDSETSPGREEIIAGFIRPFDLSKAPLLRVGLINREQERHILLFDMHHIISDGVSMEILRREFIYSYEKRELPRLYLHYKDFAQWQNRMLASGEIKKQEAYWLERFKDGVPPLKLATDFSRSAATWSKGDSIGFKLDEKMTRRIRQQIKKTETTLYMILLAVYNVLLSKYTGQEDLVVGLPMAGRNQPRLQDIIGFFINTLVIRNFPGADKTFREFLMEVKKNALDAYENQDYPFDFLVNQLNIPRNPARNPMFDAMFVLQNIDSEEKISSFTVKPYKYGQKSSHFDLHLQAYDNPETINLSLEYSRGLFKRTTVEIITKHFVEIAKQAATDIDIKLKDIKIAHHFLLAKSIPFKDDDEEFNF